MNDKSKNEIVEEFKKLPFAEKLAILTTAASRNGLTATQIRGQLNRVVYNLDLAEKARDNMNAAFDAGNMTDTFLFESEMKRFHGNVKRMIEGLAEGVCDEDAEDWA